MRTWLGFGSVAVAGILGVAGCGSMEGLGSYAGAGGGDFGATQGGVQDMGFARELVAAGRVPPPEAFLVEGMFSEHDLPLDGPACSRLLCLRGAAGIAPAEDLSPSTWVQIGMSSTIDPDTFERPSVTVIATVDVSGSMGWAYEGDNGEYAPPGELARALLTAITGELGPADRVAIVTYGTDSETVLGITPGGDPAIARAIAGLEEDGSTNMEAGLQVAYALAGSREAQMTDERRLILFTDVQPNVGATSGGQFEQMASAGAADGIGLTVMAVGLGMGQEVLNAMSHLRGGNAFSVFDREDVGELMEESWPWMVSPIAYDLSVDLVPAAGFAVADTYGFPASTGAPAAALDVSTVFLSKKKGALLVRFEPDQGFELSEFAAHGTLGYTTPEGEAIEETVDVAPDAQALDELGESYGQPSVRASVALALLVTGMKTAATQYQTDRGAALATMSACMGRYSLQIEPLADPALDAEFELARELRRLMDEGAAQGDMYGEGQDF